MNKPEQLAIRGRPREFCVTMRLRKALRVFWSKGYEGASLTDLTEAMGITRPSLYAAFGNKESLFRKALDLYEREKIDISARRWRNLPPASVAEDHAAQRSRGDDQRARPAWLPARDCHRYLRRRSPVGPRGARSAGQRHPPDDRRSLRARQGRGRLARAYRRRRISPTCSRPCCREFRSRRPVARPARSSTGWSKPACTLAERLMLHRDLTFSSEFFISRYIMSLDGDPAQLYTERYRKHGTAFLAPPFWPMGSKRARASDQDFSPRGPDARL